MADDIFYLLQASSLLIRCLFIADPDIYIKLAEEHHLSELLQKGILSNVSQATREIFQELIYFLVANIRPNGIPFNKTPLGQLIVNMLDLNVVLREPNCGELCELLVLMIDIYKPFEAKGEKLINTSDKLKELLSTLQQYKSKEITSNAPCDNVLLGLLQLTNKIVSVKEYSWELDATSRIQIIEEVFYSCLFPLREKNIEGGYKCKNSKTREVALKLISTLKQYKSECVHYFFKDCILPLRNSLSELTVWNYIPEKFEKSSSGYVGIKNLGCICYIISILQQMFMIAPFRNVILSVEDNKPPAYNEAGIDDNLLHQLQNLFGYLLLSGRKDYNPTNLCFSIKEPDGKPINTNIQHDAHEFLNIIFERLERLLKPTRYGKVLQSIFGGKCCSQVVCKKCGNISSTYEDYYTLSLEIKNQKTLYDALDRYIASNGVSDFYCEVCKKRLDVEKRTLLSTLPNVLIVHLQRFTFNFDTLMNEKVFS